MKVKDIMTSNVATVSETSTIKDVAMQMKNLNVGSIPVCDDSNIPIGIVTDRDIVLRNVSEGLSPSSTVNNVMTNNLISCTPETDVHEAASIMAKNQIRRLPVIQNNKIVGVLAIGDLAIRNILVDDAGEALSSISETDKEY